MRAVVREDIVRTIVTRGLITGAVLAASTAGVMMIASRVESGSPWAGLNAMATAVGVGERPLRDRFDAAVTPVGIAVLTGGLLAWGVAYEGALAATHRRGGLLTGALSGALGYALDRLVLPSRVVSNFRRATGLGGMIATYATVALAGAAASRLPRAAVRPSRVEELERIERIDDEAAAVQRPPADS